MTAVAVWDHRPAPDELLAARLNRGWSPTPTATRDGNVVLGYAACLAPDGLMACLVHPSASQCKIIAAK